MKKFLKFFINESGISSVEYALLIAFIATAVIGALVVLSSAVTEKYHRSAEDINQ